MTEDEAKEAMFELNKEYMSHPPKKRLKLYDEYRQKRAEIREQLRKSIEEGKAKQFKKE